MCVPHDGPLGCLHVLVIMNSGAMNITPLLQVEKPSLIKAKIRDFPDSPVVKNLPPNAGDTGSVPARGSKIPHAMGQLSPSVTTKA